jgi:hypothetical protein
MTDSDAIAISIAINHLDATEHALGDHGHFFSYQESPGSSIVFLVDDEDMRILGESLAAGERDAYSHWCADTTATECTLDRVLTMYLSRDPDVIEATALAEGDVKTLAALAHLRDDFIRAAA